MLRTSSRTPLLSRLPIAGQVALVALVGVLGLGALGAISLWQSARQDDYSHGMSRAGAAQEESNRITINLLLARRAEKDFLLRSDERYATENVRILADAASHFTVLRSATDEPSTRAEIDQAVAGIAEYGRLFGSRVATKKALGLNESSGLLAQLRTTVHET